MTSGSAGKRRDRTADELGRFGVGEVEPRRRLHDLLRPDQSRVERNGGDAMGPKLDRHIGGHLVGRGLRHAIGHIARCASAPPRRRCSRSARAGRDHRPCRQLARVVVRAHAGAEHRVPSPQRLFPERLAPGERAVFNHPFVSAPDVVDEDVDPVRLPSDALERGRHFGVHRWSQGMPGDRRHQCTIGRGSAGDEHARALVSQRACDAAADAKRAPSDDGDTVVEG